MMEVDPFDEPDVAVSKQKTSEMLAGGSPQPEPSLRSQGLALFAAPDHAQVLRKAAGTLRSAAAASPAGWIAAHLALRERGRRVLRIHLEERASDKLLTVLNDAIKLLSNK